ncbi:MAG: tetratricopeptide repeat protein, partial [Limisphaerales bacterium]
MMCWLECYDRAAVLDPDLMVGPEKGRVFLHLRRFEEAIALFDQGIKANPDMPCFRQNKGTALFALDRT